MTEPAAQRRNGVRRWRKPTLEVAPMLEMGTAAEVFRNPAHPYTRGLLHSVPTLHSDRAKPLQTIEGTVPAIAALPPLLEIAPGHFARCPVTAPEAS